jgi:hypothetical protein
MKATVYSIYDDELNETGSWTGWDECLERLRESFDTYALVDHLLDLHSCPDGSIGVLVHTWPSDPLGNQPLGRGRYLETSTSPEGLLRFIAWADLPDGLPFCAGPYHGIVVNYQLVLLGVGEEAEHRARAIAEIYAARTADPAWQALARGDAAAAVESTGAVDQASPPASQVDQAGSNDEAGDESFLDEAPQDIMDAIEQASSSEGLDTEEWPDEGVLQHMGYKVGKEAEEAGVRRKVLRRIIEEPLPNVNHREYMQQWGQPGSELRLRKLAGVIAAQSRNCEGRKGYELAVAHWRADLSHIRSRYYSGTYDFPWPPTTRKGWRRKRRS